MVREGTDGAGGPRDLVERLRAAMGRAEEVARAADPGPWKVGPSFGAKDSRVYVRQPGDLIDSVGTCVFASQVANKTAFRQNATFIAANSPDVALRIIQTHRRLVTLYVLSVQRDDWMRAATGSAPLRLATSAYFEAVQLLASIYLPEAAGG